MSALDEKMYEFITLPDNWQIAMEVYERMANFQQKLMTEFLSEIQKNIGKKINFYRLEIKTDYEQLVITQNSWKGLIIKLEDIRNKPYVGVWYDTESNKLSSQILEEITANLKAADARMNTDPGWLGWYYAGENFPKAIFDRILPSNRQSLIEKYSFMLIELIENAKPIIENAVSKV